MLLHSYNTVRRLPVLWTTTVLRDVFLVALGVHVVVVLTHATCERRIDAKASSEDAVVDVEVDRCIDENSASNYGGVALLNASFTEASPKLHRDSSQISLPEPNVPVHQSHREAPTDNNNNNTVRED